MHRLDFGFPCLLALCTALSACQPEGAESPGEDPTPEPPAPWICQAGDRDGPVGESENETSGSIDFNLRTPQDYDPELGSPLVVVYAAAGANEASSEAFHDLTEDALGEGYIIAYADHISPSSQSAVDFLADVLHEIVDEWCVDEDRVYFTGHSDGGTVASLLVIWDRVEPRPAAIAPGGAGLNEGFLSGLDCSDTLPVMVTHGANDSLFPGFGAQAARWWAQCNGCADEAEPGPDGDCEVYSGCEGGAEVRYCENELTHPQWPNFMNDEILDFFGRFPL